MNNKRRIYFLSICIFVTFILLAWRLATIQLMNQQSFGPHKINLVENSLKQRITTFSLSNGRGEILDRNGKPLMNVEKDVLLLLPFVKQDRDNVVDRVSHILHLPAAEEERLSQEIDEMTKPLVFIPKDKSKGMLTKNQIFALQQLKHPGIRPVNMQFNQTPSLAQHGLGIVKMYKDMPNQVSYVSGVNEDFNRFLQSNGERSLSYYADGKGGSLIGGSVPVSTVRTKPYSIITTIDLELQERVEKIINRVGLESGAVILLDIQDNEVLTMASRPLMDVTNPFEKKNLDKVVRNQKVGSVFKTVVLAAALETNTVNPTETFDCNRDLNDQMLPLSKQQGVLTLEDSFAKSCNRTFGEIGSRVISKNPNALEEYIEKLGVANKVGWEGTIDLGEEITQFLEEEMGTIWGEEKEEIVKTPRSIMSTAIGQQNVQFSPLALANMMATIARGGEAYEVKRVKSIISPDGNDVIILPAKKMTDQQLQPTTIKMLQSYLRSVVTKGTGQSYFDLPYAVAGKSGTAQTGNHTYLWNNDIKKDVKVDVENKWFAGYFPFDNPKYALVVLNKDAVKEDSRGRDIFSSIVKEIYDYNEKK